MKVAIVGAGFWGLATAWHLLEADCSVTLFDKKGIGGGASGMAAGLLHAFLGTRARKAEFADAGMEAALELLEVASRYGKVANKSGILRPPTSPEQIIDFQKAAQTYPEAEWWEEARVKEMAPFLHPTPALFIRNGITVDSPAYLHNLFLALQARGVNLIIQDVASDEELPEFDFVVFTVGAGARKILDDPQISIVKGQILEVEKPCNLPFAVAGSAYFTGTVLGATFERGFQDLAPDLQKAEAYIRPRLKLISDELSTLAVVRARADARVYIGDKLPAFFRLSSRSFLAVGLGAKGLLYHACAGRGLARLLSNGADSIAIGSGFHFLEMS